MIIYQRLQYWKILRLRGEKNCKICNNKSKSNLNLPEARYFNAGLPNLAKRFCRRLGANHVDTEEWKKKQRRSKRSIWWYAKVIDSPRSFRNNGHDDQDRTVHRRALRAPLFHRRVHSFSPSPVLDLDPMDQSDRSTRIQGSREQEVVLLQVSNEMTDVTCARPSSDHPFLIHCPLETMTRRVSSNKRFQQKEKIGKEKER